MTEADLNKLWNVIPVGETNAAAASAIWKRLGMYTPSINRPIWLFRTPVLNRCKLAYVIVHIQAA